MKTKKLILGSFLALAGIVNAQNTFPTPSGNVGIGTIYPTEMLDIEVPGASGGMQIKNTNYNSAYLSLRTSGTGNGYFMLGATGSNQTEGNGRFVIHDAKVSVTRFLIDPSGNVGIGTITPGTKLHVIGTTSGIKGDASSTTSGSGVEGTGYIGVKGSASFIGVDGIGSTVGVRGISNGGSAPFRVGVRGEATGAPNNAGGYFVSSGSTSGVITFGVYSQIYNTNLGSTNYGVYSTVGGNGTAGSGPNYAGYFDGDVFTTSASYYTSDGRIKKDITKISNSLDLIGKLNPVTYNFDTESNSSITLPSEKQYGFISQEVQKIFPEFTKTIIHPAKLDEEGNELSPKKEILGLNYNGFIALLAKGIQEQQEMITAQQKQLDEQKTLIDQLSQKASTTTGINSINPVETGFQMSQNEPNPFTHETVVKYTLPQTISNAFMAVYDLTGKQITTFPINQKGSSSVTITSEKLAAGIYIYSIVADGKVIDSKRMIVAEK